VSVDDPCDHQQVVQVTLYCCDATIWMIRRNVADVHSTTTAKRTMA
jgi:hypothetical protein